MLRVLDGFRNHTCLDWLVIGQLRTLHHVGDAVHAIAAESAHEVVFQREVELGLARVALTAGTTAKLIVDTTRFVTLGADDEETACLAYLIGFNIGDFVSFLRCLFERLWRDGHHFGQVVEHFLRFGADARVFRIECLLGCDAQLFLLRDVDGWVVSA